MSRRVRTIAIIGGGFSGTVLAADLLREPGEGQTRIVLIERRREIGRGVAYEKSDYPHVLNVPASRMSVDLTDNLDFVRFAAERHPELASQAFLPREVYGEYLQYVLARAEQAASADVELRRVSAEAEHIVRLDRSGKFVVGLSDGERVIADQVVLACGDPPPGVIPTLKSLETSDAYFSDPLNARLPVESMQNVLLVGTGLTMCDIAVSIASLNSNARIHAISRHGLTPTVQSTAHATPVDHDIRQQFEHVAPTARAIVSAFRHALRQTLSRGGDWRDAVGLARTAAPSLWAQMSVREQARFLRHVRAYWDVHRHRVPAATARRISALQRAERLTVSAGRIVSARTQDGVMAVAGRCSRKVVQVTFKPRGAAEAVELEFDAVINCCGAQGRIAATNDSLLRSLIERGLALPDAHGLGITTATDGTVLSAESEPVRGLYYVGPMLRAAHWEATAASELRAYVDALAGKLRNRARSTRDADVNTSVNAKRVALI